MSSTLTGRTPKNIDMFRNDNHQGDRWFRVRFSTYKTINSTINGKFEPTRDTVTRTDTINKNTNF